MRINKIFWIIIIIILLAFNLRTCEIKSFEIGKKLIFANETIIGTEILSQKQSEIISQLQLENDKYKNENAKEKEKQEKIKALQDPVLIYAELENISKIITFEDNIIYLDSIEDKKWYKKRKLNIQLLYKFGIGIDLNKIVVDGFIEDAVIIRIDKNDLKLQYLELLSEKLILNEEVSFLSKEFSVVEIKEIFKNAEKTTKDKIKSDDELHKSALENLKQEIEILILQMGYSKVIFEII